MVISIQVYANKPWEETKPVFHQVKNRAEGNLIAEAIAVQVGHSIRVTWPELKALLETRTDKEIDLYISKLSGTYFQPYIYNWKGREKQSLLERFNKLEDNNDHTEAAMLLVKNFGTDDELKEMCEIKYRHEKRGHITQEDLKRRDEISIKYHKKLTQ